MKFFLFLLCMMALFVFAVSYSLHQENAEKARWEEFSASHHCHIEKDSPWTGKAVWQCDGFQVER